MAGAMDCWKIPRRKLVWQLGQLHYREEELDLNVQAQDVELPPLSPAERIGIEHGLLGLAVGDHIMTLYRPKLIDMGVKPTAALDYCSDGDRVRVAGRVIVRQRPPTAKGFAFITLEDEEGVMNLVIRPDVYERYRTTLRNNPILLVEGKMQRVDGVLNVIVERASSVG